MATTTRELEVYSSLTNAGVNEEEIEPRYDSFLLALPPGMASDETRGMLGKFPAARVIEINPGSLDFDAESFDLIVCDSLFVASTDLAMQLANLIKPAGHLVTIRDATRAYDGFEAPDLPKSTFAEVSRSSEIQLHAKIHGSPVDALKQPCFS